MVLKTALLAMTNKPINVVNVLLLIGTQLASEGQVLASEGKKHHSLIINFPMHSK